MAIEAISDEVLDVIEALRGEPERFFRPKDMARVERSSETVSINLQRNNARAKLLAISGPQSAEHLIVSSPQRTDLLGISRTTKTPHISRSTKLPNLALTHLRAKSLYHHQDGQLIESNLQETFLGQNKPIFKHKHPDVPFSDLKVLVSGAVSTRLYSPAFWVQEKRSSIPGAHKRFQWDVAFEIGSQLKKTTAGQFQFEFPRTISSGDHFLQEVLDTVEDHLSSQV